MPPEPRGLSPATAIDRAIARARLTIAAEAAAVGAAVAAWSIPAGFAVAAAFAVLRSRQASRHAVVRALEHADPQSRNLIVTADELSAGVLVAKPHVRERIEADAALLVASIDPSSTYPLRTLTTLLLIAAVAWVVVGALRLKPRQAPTLVAGPASAAPTGSTATTLTITVRIESPSYTHLPTKTVVNPAQLDVIEHATLLLSIASPAASVTVDASGSVHRIESPSNGTFDDRLTATRSGYVLIVAGDGARRMIPIAVRPDALPAVKIVAPGRDLVYEGGNPRITVTAQATDDFGLGSLGLRYTKLSGSGEQFTFTDGEIPLAITRDDDRDWKGSAVRTLGELALSEGDMLVYRAVATDLRPGAVEASSDAFYIEVSRLGVAAGDAFTLPEQETRYALSQQMLIVKTDRLQQRRASMTEADFTEASQSLAVEQRMIRSEFVFMLGGEIEDEEVEAEQSVEIQAGRLANRGQRDIRAATVAMSQAEKLLTATNTADALKAERAAVEALQRAFARDRYILRALASRSQLDLARRLTGSAVNALGWRRQLADAPANRRGIALQSLLQGLGEAATPQQVEVLAEFTVRADPDSAALRSIAADLQKVADSWTSTAAARPSQLDAIAERVAQEARRTLADAPAAVGERR